MYRQPNAIELNTPTLASLRAAEGWYINPVNYTQIAWYDGFNWTGHTFPVAQIVANKSKLIIDSIFVNKPPSNITTPLSNNATSPEAERPIDKTSAQPLPRATEQRVNIRNLCVSCDSVIENGQANCMVCGMKVSSGNNCSNCGQSFTKKMLICTNCGQRI